MIKPFIDKEAVHGYGLILSGEDEEGVNLVLEALTQASKNDDNLGQIMWLLRFFSKHINYHNHPKELLKTLNEKCMLNISDDQFYNILFIIRKMGYESIIDTAITDKSRDVLIELLQDEVNSIFKFNKISVDFKLNYNGQSKTERKVRELS